MNPAEPVLFYPVWVPTAGSDVLHWGQPCGRAQEAKMGGRKQVEAGRASVAFVVRVEGEKRIPLLSYIHPQSARKIIEHWEAVKQATPPERPDTR
jgi:hypothetical protein